MPLDPQVELALQALAAQGMPRLSELEPAEARRAFEEMLPPVPGETVTRVEDRRLPGPEGEIAVRIYAPEGARGGPAIAYFHGGGWVIGSRETHDALCRSLANRSGCTVVSVDYRLAPESRFPAAAEDCYAAARWVAEKGAEIGVDGARLAVAGDSAGGNLAAVTALMARDRGGPALRFQLLVYPVTDCDFDRPSYRENAEGYLLERADMQWFWDHYVPDRGERTHPYASPLRAESLADLPPALVMTAGYDPLRDEGAAYAERLRADGVVVEHARYDGMIHGFVQLVQFFDESRRAVDRAAAALRNALA
jgi:acetyl esterase/lipase